MLPGAAAAVRAHASTVACNLLASRLQGTFPWDSSVFVWFLIYF